MKPNRHKKLSIEVAGIQYLRLPIKTHVIKATDPIVETISIYAKPHLKKGDILFISEKIIAIMQGRSFPVESIQISFWAKLLSHFVVKTSYGIGLGCHATMQLAIEEAGLCRILIAALASILTKPLGIRGVFYRVVGKNIAAIDGPCSYTLPPYNHYAKLPPKNPNAVAESLQAALGCEVVIIDANDIGVAVLGNSSKELTTDFAKQVFRDNPLGQTNEQTPIGIVRPIRSSKLSSAKTLRVTVVVPMN